jgi:hypothetical protein
MTGIRTYVQICEKEKLVQEASIDMVSMFGALML